MRPLSPIRFRSIHTRNIATEASRIKHLTTLPDGTIDTFRAAAFVPEIPALLPRGSFTAYPAISKWFSGTDSSRSLLNTAYLTAAADADANITRVPLEVTHGASTDGRAAAAFQRTEAPLSVFLAFIAHAQRTTTEAPVSVSMQGTSHGETETASDQPRIYLAQCPLAALPPAIAADLPAPTLVSHAGRGDIYDSSIWLGLAPTLTPLHRDPNPNVFVQLAGRKALRVFAPDVGDELFRSARHAAGLGAGSAAFRGEEMMHGAENEALERAVWGNGVEAPGFEAVVASGDAVFIPKGWWHSFKGLGEGVVGSVNWWFR